MPGYGGEVLGETMEMETDFCVVCGRTEEQDELTDYDKQRNLHEQDVQLTHCSGCGASVCGFCDALDVCH